ncbi:hypothetical protein CYMTET_47642 [Cymbomonas tetramitiformis]|uniref:Uncharacterized protein n=1 Tax=Cymbomonas tetramitiformis TaxID=36881 RepID=A0AAE0BUY1_9CHLO|nr:hypothetical protein CYMTET_47642 [Cymbomonas tetramitiformis]
MAVIPPAIRVSTEDVANKKGNLMLLQPLTPLQLRYRVVGYADEPKLPNRLQSFRESDGSERETARRPLKKKRAPLRSRNLGHIPSLEDQLNTSPYTFSLKEKAQFYWKHLKKSLYKPKKEKGEEKKKRKEDKKKPISMQPVLGEQMPHLKTKGRTDPTRLALDEDRNFIADGKSKKRRANQRLRSEQQMSNLQDMTAKGEKSVCDMRHLLASTASYTAIVNRIIMTSMKLRKKKSKALKYIRNKQS